MTDDQNEGQPSRENLDDVFNGNDDADVQDNAHQAEPEPKGEESETDQVDDDAEPPAAEDDTEDKGESQSVPVAALKSERQKRQAAEAKLNELEKRLAPQSDDAGEQDISQLLFAERTNMSREVMIDLKPDYVEMETIFAEIAKNNPALTMEMMKSPNPAKYAYTKAKEHVELEELKKVKNSSEWEEFQKWKQSKPEKPVEKSPDVKRKESILSVPNLNKATSMSSNSTQREKLQSLDEMFDD